MKTMLQIINHRVFVTFILKDIRSEPYRSGSPYLIYGRVSQIYNTLSALLTEDIRSEPKFLPEFPGLMSMMLSLSTLNDKQILILTKKGKVLISQKFHHKNKKAQS